MTRENFIIAGVFIVLMLVITGIIFVIFGQVTVRKLRSIPMCKDLLGIELVSGWSIFNVAIIMSMPKRWSRILNNGAMSFYFPNAEALGKYTTRTDRLLAHLLFGLTYATVIGLFALMAMDKLGFVRG